MTNRFINNGSDSEFRIVTHVSFDGIRVEDELIESDGAKETQEQGQLLEPPSIKC